MKKRKKSLHFNRIGKRIISFFIAIALIVGSVPLSDLGFDSLDGLVNRVVYAADDEFAGDHAPNLSSYAQIIKYAKNYANFPAEHQDDNITIAISGGDSYMNDFVSIGTSQYPFAGSITINSSSPDKFNIKTAFFDYVYDHVIINAQGQKHFTICPIADFQSNAVVANHVLHDNRSTVTYGAAAEGKRQVSAQTWEIYIGQYGSVTPSHGSVIGSMEENAELTIDLNNGYSAAVEVTAEAGNSAGLDINAGVMCGSMKTGSKLTVASIAGSDMTSVTSSKGHAGGLVGEMATGSTLTVSGTSSSYIDPTSAITSSEGYAGGLVGYNDRATVTLTNGYTNIKNTISGKLGAGGLYGYYKPIMVASDPDYPDVLDTYGLSLDTFSIGDSTRRSIVSSSGGAGGFFGVLDNPGGTITLSGTNSKTVYIQGNSDNTVFGGIIGTYKADSLNDTLSVSGSAANNMLTVNTNKSGNLSYYGGIIGNVNDARFVSISNVNVTASSADDEFFGGVVACIDDGYVYVNNFTLSNTSSYKGGAIVGHTTNGVVHMAGATNLSSASSGAGNNYGQIIGYRDSALVFADSSWNLTRNSTSTVAADDIGSWGEVVRFKASGFFITDVLSSYYNPSASSPVHYATVKAATITDNKITLSSKATFATAALNMQLNDGTSDSSDTNNTAVLRFADVTNCEYDTLKTKSIRMTASIDLSHTGMTGLTRDNGSRVQYCGAEFDGVSTSNKLTLAIGEGYEGNDTTTPNSAGKGMIYRHTHNGLFGETSENFTIKNVTISGKVHTNDRINDTNTFYVGTVAGNAAKAFNASAVTVDNNTSITFATYNSDNKDTLYVGGLVGKMSAPGTSTIGSQSYTGTTNCTFSASITGTAAKGTPFIGGVSGYVDGGKVSVYDVKISGSVTNSGIRKGQYIGGLFANVQNCTLALDGVELNGLTVKGKMNSESGATMGGLLGYNYFNTTATFNNIKVLSCTLDNDSTTGRMAGLVNMGSGYWKFQKVEIGGNTPSVNGITLSGNAAESFGMLVNRASSGDSAMYLELPAGFTYKIYNVTAANAPTIYDEIAVNTKLADSIEENGNPIVSISTNGTTKYGVQTDTKVNMTSGDCNTYQNQVTSFNKVNPNSRYYYNLDTYKAKDSLNAAENLFLYSVKQYAHSTISGNFTAATTSTFADGTGTDTLDLDGYSYYPFDVSGTVNLSGKVALHNEEIEAKESADGGDSFSRTTLNSTITQHYLMHAGLFRDVNGTINIDGTLSLDGTIPDTDTYCGALICGTIGGSSSSSATFTSNNSDASISLAGIKVHNKDATYSPLLINKASTNVVLDVYNVSASGYLDNDTIATSLIGKVGMDNAEKVRVTFSNIKLDARETASTPSELDGVYDTTKCLFTRATLLESLTYAPGAGSSGVYNYEYDEDWDSSQNHIGNVTYGKEISESTSKNYKKEFWYNNQNHSSSSAHYTDPEHHDTTGNSDESAPVSFSGYRPYVAIWGSSIGSSSTKHQLDVNHVAATFGGCGTYNDPYKITDGNQLESIAKILSGDDDNGTFWLYYPDDNDQWCDNKEQHKAYRYYNTTFTTEEGTSVTPTEGAYYQVVPFTVGDNTEYYVTDASKDVTLTPDTVRKHLAGAYYYIDNNITIDASSGYQGLGSNADDTYAFHGVIAGNDKTITNQSASPLIYASNGCVIRNLEVVAENNSIFLSGTASDSFNTSGGCGAYGAVIGRVFGGDNILDKVKVNVSSATVTPTALTPVGGYIGVIVEGGVFFRHMDNTNVPVANKTGFATVNNDVATIYAESNKQYLYCNPIIGRVINGFAVTEADAYAPYEDGTRRFESGATPASGNTVTLKNGNKNYSITDIVVPSSDSDKLNVSSKSFDVNSSQQFFVMSLIINSGMGTNGTSVVGYYGANQMTRRADYSDVGTTVKKTDSGYTNTDAWKDYQKAVADNITNPYLLEKYAKGNNNNYHKKLGSESGFTINLKADLVLPDGYKGIGNIYGTKTIIDTTKNTEARLINDNLQLALSNFYGNDHSISQNTSYYSYTNGNDNYLPYTHYSYVDKGVTKYINNIHGLGLFNYVKNATYKECILTGNVKTRQYNTDGTAPNFTRSDDFTALAAGMFIGTLNMGGAASITDVYLNDTYTEGSREAAGLIGFLINGNNKISISNTTDKSTESKEIRVSAGTSAAGLIARQGHIDSGPSGGVGEIEIKLNGHQFDYVSIVSRYDGTFEANKWNADWAFGVGGLIGIARAGTNNISATNNHITIEGVNIGKAVGDNARVVACEYIDSSGQTVRGNVYTGGLVGVANKAPIDATDCNIYNVTVSSANYSGGVLGWGGTWSNINLDNFTIKNTLNGDNAAKIISNSTGNAGCVVGFCKGGDDKQSMGSLKINDSIIEGYTVEAGYAGAALGDWNSSRPFSINNSIVKDCNINYYTAGGGLAGQLQQNLNGYNVRVSGIVFTKKGSAATTDKGYIAGNRKGGTIKIVGFQRTGTISEPKLVGNNTNNVMSDMYGSTGYVVFADYEGKSALDPPSNKNASGIGSMVAAASPYITVNPTLTLDANINLLTGDGISLSAVNSILTDASDKKYQVKVGSSLPRSYFLNGSDIDTNTVSDFNTELGEVITGTKPNFPILVIDNPENAETDVNRYLQMLTNTSLDFSNSNGGLKANTASTDVGTVTIYKCAYSNGTYTLTNNDACLTINGDSFSIRQNNNIYQYDTANQNGQFTLIDVAFKDPSNSSDVAYHLYVPVIVKKLLEYNFDISAVSGSTYDVTKYTSRRGRPLLENLGTPVTFEFEYKYLRTATEWANEDTNYYYAKSLTLTNTGDHGIGDEVTQLLLIDMNRGGKPYYLDEWDGVSDITLSSFKDDAGLSFFPVSFNQMITDQGITGDQTLTEKYYLTVFTNAYERPANNNDALVAHYEITSSNFIDGDHPSRRVDCEDNDSDYPHNRMHLIIGDFYKNTIEVSTTPEENTDVMSSTNKDITVNLTARVRVVNTETHAAIDDYLRDSNVTIYQSFLVLFEKYKNAASTGRGITAIDSCTITPGSYTIKRYDEDDATESTVKNNIVVSGYNADIKSGFIELQNNTDISGQLQRGKLTISATTVLSFNSEQTRGLQFPLKEEGDNSPTGAIVIGKSNISSNQTTTAYSAVSSEDDDSNSHYYYTESEESAKLIYYADYSGASRANQKDMQLGINAREIENLYEASTIYSEGRYDATKLLKVDDIKYLKCTIELYQKNESGVYPSTLNIGNYLRNVVVNGEDTQDASLSTATKYVYVFEAEDVDQFVNEDDVYKIPISFDVVTGNQTSFKNNASYIYANYKVVLTVSAFDHNGATDTQIVENVETASPWSRHLNNSERDDFLIYTNARVYTDQIKTN